VHELSQLAARRIGLDSLIFYLTGFSDFPTYSSHDDTVVVGVVEHFIHQSIFSQTNVAVVRLCRQFKLTTRTISLEEAQRKLGFVTLKINM